MKVFKGVLIGSNVGLLFAGCWLCMAYFPEGQGKLALFAALIGLGALNVGYYMYFYKRFVALSEEICRNAQRIMRNDRDPAQLNKETLTSKVAMELEKMEDIAWSRLSKSQQEKRRLQQAVSEISHQLKTPLSNIRMYHDMISDPEATKDEAKNFMSIAGQQIEKLEFLMDSLIKASRLESDMIKLHIGNNGIFHTLELAVNGIVQKADKKDIDISIYCHPAIKAFHDVKWTAEALENILDNAVKYTQAGGKIQIHVVSGEMYVEVKIEDTGRGICPQHYHDIFRRFYRESSVSKEEGLGLGLYIARKIIVLQGGSIMVRSVVGKGSCFSVCLPNRKIM